MRVVPGVVIGTVCLVSLGALLLASGERDGVPSPRGSLPAPGHPTEPPPPPASPAASADDLLVRQPVPGLAGPGRPIVVEGQLVELLAIGAAKPNRPAGGYRVTLEPRTGEGPVVETVTGADGGFRFELAPREERPFYFTLRVAGDERYRPTGYTRKIERGRSEHSSVLLRRALRRVPHGVVVDPEGNPLGGVLLRYGGPRGNRLARSSAADGSFELIGRDEYDVHDLEAEGYRLLRSRDSERRALGGWSTGVLTLEAVTSFTLRVVDAGGAPVEGARVRVLLRDEEPTFDWRPDSASVGTTDRDGRLELDQVWCGRPLAVEVATDDFESSAIAHRDGVLQFAPGATGQAIILRPEQPTELLARLVGGLRIVGRITNFAGREVEVELCAGSGAGCLEPVEVGDDGSFVLHVPRRLRGGTLTVTARETRRRSDRDGPPAIARQVVDEAQAREEQLSMILSLQPSASIRGVLTGSPSSVVELWAVSSGSTDPLEARREGEMEGTWNGRPFVIGGLVPGREYDLVLCLGRGVWGGGVRVVRRVPAGSSGLEIPFPDTEAVDLRLVPEDPGVELRRVRVRTVRYHRDSPRSAPVGSTLLDELHAWPEELGWSTGEHGSLAGEGSFHSKSFRFLRRHDVHLPPTQAGEYRIGVQAESRTGTVYAMVTSAVMTLTPGEYTLRFALKPTGKAEVDCSKIATGEYWLRLRHAWHGDVPVSPLDGAWARPVRGRETVSLEGIPVGRYELLVGERRELSDGRARWRVPVEIRENERSAVRIVPR